MQADLIERAQKGDREAFSALAEVVSARLYGTAVLILRQPDRAEDAVQDALVEAWRDIRGLRDPSRLDAWLHRLLVRNCYRHSRRESVRRRIEVSVPEIRDIQVPQGNYESDVAAATAARDEMERAFRRLTTEHRTLLALIYYADLSLADASVAMGIPIGTTKSRHSRAMAALRSAMAADQRTPQLADGQVA